MPSVRRDLHLLFYRQFENDGKISMRRRILRTKKNLKLTKRKTEMSTFVLHNHTTFLPLPQGDQEAKKYFNLSWLRVKMSYDRFNTLSEFINGDHAAKIGRGILSKDLWIENVTVLFHIKSTESVSMKVNVGLHT